MLSQLNKQIVSYIEEFFWEYQTVPGQEKIKEQFGVYPPLENPEFREVLSKKYLLSYYDDSPDGLTANQLLALNAVCNPDDKRTLRVKLNQMKITSQQWHVWMNDPKFMRHFAGRMHRNFKNALPEVMMSVVESATGGDVKAQTLYLEMTGAYTRSSNLNVNIDVDQTLDKLVEILQEELDAETFERIANRFKDEIESNSKTLAKANSQLALSAGFDF